jgi:hypothetical protein
MQTTRRNFLAMAWASAPILLSEWVEVGRVTKLRKVA